VQASRLFAGKEYTEAAALFERWLAVNPRDSFAWYDLASVYAALGNTEKAIDAFERAVDAGLSDQAEPTKNTFYAPLLAEPRFVAAVARLTERQKTQEPLGAMTRTAPMTVQGTYLVMLPPDYDPAKSYPLCIIVHGSGDSERGLSRRTDVLAREGVIYVALRAPYISLPVTMRYDLPSYSAWPNERIEPDSPMEETIRRDYVNWIVTATQAAQKEFRVSPEQTYLFGYSQGGGFTKLTAMLHPEIMRGYFSLAGSEVPEKWTTDDRLAKMRVVSLPRSFTVTRTRRCPSMSP